MNKFKFHIQKNNLSWENTNSKSCDRLNCNKNGEFRAPKSRIKLNEYFFFCLKHVKEYNKSWDFYKGLTIDQIEYSMRKDTIWDRPSWPLKGSPKNIMDQINQFSKEENLVFEGNTDYIGYYENKLIDETLTKKENMALRTLNLRLPLTLEKIKKNYKKLVKIFHPDVNDNDKVAENKFKEINESYKILLKKFVK